MGANRHPPPPHSGESRNPSPHRPHPYSHRHPPVSPRAPTRLPREGEGSVGAGDSGLAAE